MPTTYNCRHFQKDRRKFGSPSVMKLFVPIVTVLLLCSTTSNICSVEASTGSPFSHSGGSHRWWGSATISPSKSSLSTTNLSNAIRPNLFPRQRRRFPSKHLYSPAEEDHEEKADEYDDDENLKNILRRQQYLPPHGGQDSAPDAFVKTVGTITQVVTACGKFVLPPLVTMVSLIVNIYRGLPKDAIVAQIGLVYCFAGGYYPTLFSSLQAAQHCGWNVMVSAIQDLTEEATRVVQALSLEDVNISNYGYVNNDIKRQQIRRLFLQRTSIVMSTLDPMKINQAAGALYTTWLGVSSVLEKEYARVITLSMTLAGYIERIATFVLAPPAYLCVQAKYHQWVPVVIGWGCKAAAMNIAWRIQRLMTAATSAVTGGLLFARAITRMLSKRGIRWFGLIPDEEDHHESTPFDEIIGFMVAGLGFYTQFETQWRSGFSFRVPFPLSLITWPFDWAEKWIQWQITK